MNTKPHGLGGNDDDTAFDFDDVVSGEFDAELTRAETAPEKRVLLPQPESPKLHKVLAQSGLGSRIEMERLIAEGHVAVNNEVATWASACSLATKSRSMAVSSRCALRRHRPV